MLRIRHAFLAMCFFVSNLAFAQAFDFRGGGLNTLYTRQAGILMRDGWAAREDNSPGVWLILNGTRKGLSSIPGVQACGFDYGILAAQSSDMVYNDVVVVDPGSLSRFPDSGPATCPPQRTTAFPDHPIGSTSRKFEGSHQVESRFILFPDGTLTGWVKVESDEVFVGTCGNSLVVVTDADRNPVTYKDGIGGCVDGKFAKGNAVNRYMTVTHRLTPAELLLVKGGAISVTAFITTKDDNDLSRLVSDFKNKYLGKVAH